MLRTSYHQSVSGDPPMKKYINPSSFQSMVKSYGIELPTLTSIHHIRDNTQISKGGHRKKCSICRQIGHNRNNCPDKPVDEQTAPES